MKIEKYESPDLELIEIVLEGSFLNSDTHGVGIEGGEGGGGEDPEEDYWG